MFVQFTQRDGAGLVHVNAQHILAIVETKDNGKSFALITLDVYSKLLGPLLSYSVEWNRKEIQDIVDKINLAETRNATRRIIHNVEGEAPGPADPGHVKETASVGRKGRPSTDQRRPPRGGK